MSRLICPTALIDEVKESFRLEEDLRSLGVVNPDYVIEQLDRLGWRFTSQPKLEDAA